jgi:voltage-gated potassium channel
MPENINNRPARAKTRRRLKIRYAAVALLLAMAFGIFGFHFIEGLSWVDSFYMTAQTVTTVGYGDLAPRTDGGKIFVAFFMLAGVAAVAYILSSAVQVIVQSEFIAAFSSRRQRRGMKNLNNHFIICGAGRVGRRIIEELEKTRTPFVVIERDENRAARLTENGDNVLFGDATLESVLREAGVARARGLATCLADDADNVYVVLVARDLNRNLHIVARAVEEQAEPRLIKAGANRVVAPIIIGSHRMAQALTKPAVADFMESVTAENLELGFEEVELDERSPYANKTLRQTNIRSALNVVIVALRRRDGTRLFNPTGEVTLESGDLLIAIGRAESLQEVVKTARGEKQ